MNMFFDEIGNPITPAPAVVDDRIAYDGYMYNSAGLLFMYASGTYTPQDFQLSLDKWGAVGFQPLDGQGLTKDNSAEYWVDKGQLKQREPLPATLDGHVLKGVPDGGKVTIEGIEYATDGTDITLQFGRPGTYVVKCEGFPYTPVEVEVVYGN